MRRAQEPSADVFAAQVDRDRLRVNSVWVEQSRDFVERSGVFLTHLEQRDPIGAFQPGNGFRDRTFSLLAGLTGNRHVPTEWRGLRSRQRQ
jgi:hypothetical protein